MKLTIFLINFFLIGSCFGQTLAGQETKFSQAIKLDHSINSDAEEIAPLVSEDGKTMYYSRVFHPENKGGEFSGQDIWFSEKIENIWGTTHNLEKLNNGDNNAVVGINHSADRLYLINNYSAHSRRKLGLASCQKNANGEWGDIEELPIVVTLKNDHYGFYVDPDEKFIIISMEGKESFGEEDLYVSMNKDGIWSEPFHLGSVINTGGYEISPFLSRDKRTLFFASSGHEGFGGADIYKTTRLDEDWKKWTKPENLGKEINTANFEAYFSMSKDGNVYFSRALKNERSDIYTSKLLGFKNTPAKETLVKKKASKNVNGQTKSSAEKRVKTSIPIRQLIFFDAGSAKLSDRAKKTIQKVSAIANNQTDLSIELKGHSDNNDSEDVNLKLSERRVEAVKQYLDQLVKKTHLKTVNYGKAKATIKPVSMNVQREKDRRVEIIFFRE